ncbi:MAG: class IV adenylate cyclase [Candidatus Sabulitectum sp.]|nr:class IV adenylate cyclase [Candidatus Sabulitectum sp.]
MFTEVELKYPVKDFTEIRGNLLQAGAELYCEATAEKNTVFDLPDGSLKHSGTLLRLREFRGEVILTVKESGLPGAMKIRHEHETVLSIPIGEAKELLKALNYSPVFHYEKTREMWHLADKAHICLDTLFFGKFVEIEADSQLGVSNTSLILDLDPGKGLNLSYKKLQLLYEARGG